GSKTPNTGSLTIVNPAPATKLVIATQPSSSATAGAAFSQQPVVLIQDQYNNVRTSDSLVVTASRIGGTGIMLGTTNISASSGTATFANLAAAAATNLALQFTSGALTPAISSNVLVNAGPFSRLLVLLPGETFAPGTLSGRTGAASATAGNSVTVRAMATDT